MNILLVSNMYPSKQKPYAGIFVKNIYEALKGNKSFQVSLHVMKRTYTGWFGSLLKYLWFGIKFLTHIPRKYDIVHLHFFYPLIFLTVLYKIIHPRTALVVTYHGSDIENHCNTPLEEKVFRWCAKFVDHHIAVGSDLALTVKKKLKTNSVDIMPAGVNEDIFYPEQGIMKKYDFIFVGSFYVEKGVIELIDAIKLLNNPSIRICFVGSGLLLNELNALKKDFKITIFQNQTQDQLRHLYNQSKFMVLPSKRESFGLVVSEAMYCGTPVVVSSIGGLVDQVKNGYNGYVIDNVSDIAIKEGLEVALSAENEAFNSLVFNAKKSNKEYSLTSVIRYHRNIYDQLIKQ